MSDGRTLISKIILAISVALCIVTIAGVLYTRFQDSRVESIIAGSGTQQTPSQSVPAPEPEDAISPAKVPTVKESTGDDAPAPTQPATKVESPEVLSVRNTVAAFYNDYFRLYDAGDEPGDSVIDMGKGARIVDFLYERPDVDSSFAEKIDRLVTSLLQDPEIRGLPSDPLVMSRALPLEMQFDDPVIAENKADIIAYTLWDKGARRPICLSLVKTDAVWKIENIIDMNLPGGMSECGGKKAGQAQTAPVASPARPLPQTNTQSSTTPVKPPEASSPTAPPATARPVPAVGPPQSPARSAPPSHGQTGVVAPIRPPSRSAP